MSFRKRDSEVKEAIIDEFIRQFNQFGIKVNLDTISTNLHISKKTIYKFFPSKETIYEEILQEASDDVLSQQIFIYNDATLNTHQKICKLLTISTKREKEIDMARIPELKASDPVFYQKLMDAYERQWDYFLTLLEEGKKDGSVPEDINPTFLVGILSGAMKSFYKKDFLRKSGYTYTEAVQALSKIILNGIFG